MKTISSDPVLVLPDFKKPFELCTDASLYGTGAVLYQRDASKPPGRQLNVIAYYSYTFSKSEINYNTTEKEALAVVMALRYFRTYLEGQHFNLFTDNQALTYLLNITQPKGRIARWVSEIQQFAFDVVHRPGKKLPDADALSRLHIPETEIIKTLHVASIWEDTEDIVLKDRKFRTTRRF